ncbi:MAG: hypothetical protein RLZZ519_144 [Bacteroidota bacterium]|jgi:signal transduction histidine kinase
MTKWHKLLERQVRKYLPAYNGDVADLAPFLQAISESYDHLDRDRELLERSMEISNRELTEANARMRAEGEMRKVTIDTLKEALTSLRYLGIDAIDQIAENEELIKIEIERRKLAEGKLEEQNEELKKVNAELDRFVYSASHDLRAPLVSVMGILQLMKNAETDDERQKLMQLAERSIKKMEHFISDIIDYAYNARKEVELVPVALDDLIVEIFESFTHGEEESRVEKQLEIQVEGIFLSDRRRLHVVLSNLIYNAIRYSDAKKTDPFVKVTVSGGNGDPFKMVVSDNGIGIPQEYLAKIFDMFFRVNNSKPGSGIGLYIVKETVSKLGGSVAVDSSVGNGTSFTLVFPQ